MQVDADLPAVDRFDLSMEGNLTNPCKRQFAAEYSQKSYESLIEKECIIGDYVNIKKSRFKVSEDARSHMVTLIDELTRLKEYKQSTFYLACSLADRYLVNIAVLGKSAPCLIRLAIIVTLMAAKLE